MPMLGRRFGELPRRAVHLQRLAVLGVVDLGDIAVGQHVGIVGRLQQRVDRRRDDVGAAQPRHPVVARAGREQLVQQCAASSSRLLVGVDDDAEIAEARLLRVRRRSRAPSWRRSSGRGAVQLEHQRLAVAVVEAGADAGPLARAGDAGLAGHRVRVRATSWW